MTGAYKRHSASIQLGQDKMTTSIFLFYIGYSTAQYPKYNIQRTSKCWLRISSLNKLNRIISILSVAFG